MPISYYVVKGEIVALVMRNSKPHLQVHWEAFDETTDHDVEWFRKIPRLEKSGSDIVLTRTDVLETEGMQNESEEESNDSLDDREEALATDQLEEETPRATRKRGKSRPARLIRSLIVAFLALMIQKVRKMLGNPLI